MEKNARLKKRFFSLKRFNLDSYFNGFSLIEVMIAVVIFAIFVTAYVSNERFNLSDSDKIKKEYLLKQLCQAKLDETIMYPPETFDESITLNPENGNFEESGFPDYEYSIEYKKVLIPDFSKLNIGEKEESSISESSQGGIQEKIFDLMKTNITEMIWQVRVTVTQKEEKIPFSLSGWILNHKAKVKIKI